MWGLGQQNPIPSAASGVLGEFLSPGRTYFAINGNPAWTGFLEQANVLLVPRRFAHVGKGR